MPLLRWRKRSPINALEGVALPLVDELIADRRAEGVLDSGVEIGQASRTCDAASPFTMDCCMDWLRCFTYRISSSKLIPGKGFGLKCTC
jgi:hypothetical protein